MRSAHRAAPVLRSPRALPHAAVGLGTSEGADRTAPRRPQCVHARTAPPRRGAKSAQPPHACSPRFSAAGLPRSAYKPLPPTKRKEGKKQAPRTPGTLRFAPPQRLPGLHAAAGGSRSPPARARRTPPPPAPRSLPSALTAWSGPSCRRAAAPQGGSAAPARPPEPPGAVGPGRERSCCAHAAARRSYSDPPIKGGQSAGGGHVTGQFQLPRRIF